MWPFKKKVSPCKKIGVFLASIIICQLAGVIGSVFTAPAIRTWYADLAKPWFAPPNWIFAPVWITLYTLMGIAFYMVWVRGGNGIRSKAMALFATQLILNAIWSIFFFGLRSPGAALVEIILLWVFIAMTIVNFNKVSRGAAWLMVPYILWVTIAALLNLSIWILNV